jgi:acetyl esterase/lipase
VDKKLIDPELRQSVLIQKLLYSSLEKENGYKKINLILKAMKGRCRSNLHYEQVYIDRPDGSKMRICVYTPRERKKNAPGLLWIHGGGYAIGLPEQEERYIKRFCEANNCIVVAPEYTLSVDKPYPAALNDCYLALKWLRNKAPQYDIRSDQLMVGGASAGGGLTAALSLYARDKKEVAIAFQMPLYPMIDDRMNSSSAKNNTAPVWNSKSNHEAWRLYLGKLFMTDDVPAYAAVARATDYSNLPPTCSFVGDLEPFYDETKTYIKNLEANGVTTYFKIFTGCYHGFDIVKPKASVSKEAIEFLMKTYTLACSIHFAEQPSI